MSESLENSYFATIRKDKFSFSKSPRFPELKSKYIKNDLVTPLITLKNLI